MNSNLSSELLFALFAVVLLTGAAGTAVALSSTVPERAQVGADVEATFTFNRTDLYGQATQWTLRGTTELTNVTWTVIGYNAADRVVNQTTYPRGSADGSTFTHPVDIDSAVVRLEVTVEGTVPRVSNYTFSPPQSFVMAEFTRVRGNNREVIETFTVHHYTNESLTARNAIADARAVVNGSNSANARQTLQRAIAFFNAAEFQNAIDAAQDAENTARQARQRSQLMQTALYVVVALVVVGAIAGAVWWYRKNQRSSRL